MFFSAAKKAAEVAGFIEAEPEEIIEEVSLTPMKQPNMICTLKQVGYVRYAVFNPADDLSILQQVFGVLKKRVEKNEMSCPDCCHTAFVEVGTFEEDEYITCPGCGNEEEFSVFDDGISEIWGTSITPAFSVGDRCGHSLQQVLNYYAALEGREGSLTQGVDLENYSFTGRFTKDGVPLFKGNRFEWHEVTPDWARVCGNLDKLLQEPSDDDDSEED